MLCVPSVVSRNGDDTASDVSRTSNIVVSAYLRTAQCVFDQGDMGDDLLVGRAELSPSLDDVVSPAMLRCALAPT